MTNGHPGIWIVDAAGKTVFADDQMAAILGVATRAEVIGSPSYTYIFPEDLDTIRRMFESKKYGDSEAHECRLRRKDGSAVLVHVQVTPMKNEVGEFSGAVSIFTKIQPEFK